MIIAAIRLALSKAFLLSSLTAFALTPILAPSAARGNALDPNFHPASAAATQIGDKTFVLPDGRFYWAGGNAGFPIAFDRLAGQQVGNLVRMNADGSRDATFRLDPSLDGYYVTAASPTADGGVVIAAARPYSLFNPLAYFYTVLRSQVFRLHADGTLDSTFNAGSGAEPIENDTNEQGAAAIVRGVVVQPDGKVLVGGQFGDFSQSGYSGLVRLNPDGSVDTGFIPQRFRSDAIFHNQSTGIAYGDQTLLLQGDGKIIVAGAFTELDGVRFPGVARLNADGSLDASFVPRGFTFAPDDDATPLPIRAAVLQADGKIVLGGPVIATTGDTATQHPVARLNADGSLDRLFAPALDVDGQPLISDLVLSVREVAGGRYAVNGGEPYLFNTDGTLNGRIVSGVDVAFSADPFFSGVARLSVQPNGGLLLTGTFDSIGGVSLPGGLARFVPKADGTYTLDTTFAAPGPLTTNAAVDRIAGVRSDGSILLRSFSDQTDGQPRTALTLLNADGSLNPLTLATPDLFNDPTEFIAPAALGLPNDQTLLFGTTLDDEGNFGFAYHRLNADGSRDASFQTDASVAAFERPLLQTDGKILVSRGAIFSNENNYDGPQAFLDGTGLQRLNADGSVDADFVFGLDLSSLLQRDPATQVIVHAPNGDSRAVAVLSDGRILYKYFDGRNYILVRLNTDGSHDSSFEQGVVEGVDVQIDTKFGQAAIDDPVTGNYDVPTEGSLVADGVGIANVLDLLDGRLLVAGDFTTYNNVVAGGLVRLRSDGAVDAAFRPGMAGAAFTVPSVIFGQHVSVDDVKLETDGKLLVVGSFDTFDGVPAPGIVRLNFDGSVDPSFVAPVSIRATGGVFSLAYNNSLYPLPDGGFLLAGNYEAPDSDLGAGPQLLFKLTADESRAPVITVVASVVETTEGNTAPGVFTVARAGDLSADLTLNYQVTGKATNGTDYVLLKGTRKLPSGKRSVKIKVKSLDNNATDGTRGVKLTLLPGEGYQLGDLIKAKVKILDND